MCGIWFAEDISRIVASGSSTETSRFAQRYWIFMHSPSFAMALIHVLQDGIGGYGVAGGRMPQNLDYSFG